jgi:crotonobetainyl-CoA:carnitine CoA-transferase CaiB-like acyl-CoA transferase
MPAYPAADVTGAWSAVAALLAALVERARTGEGAWIDASLYDAAVHLNLVGWAAEARRSRGVGEPHGLSGALPCYRIYRTADGGLLAVAPLEERFWRQFCELAGRPDLRQLQYREDEEAHRRVAEVVAGRTLAEWQDLFAHADLPIEPVLTAAQALAHPQLQARDLLRRAEDNLYRLAFPARFGAERPRAAERVPELGEHTDAVLDELGGETAAMSPARRRRAGAGPRPSLKRRLSTWWLSRRR